MGLLDMFPFFKRKPVVDEAELQRVREARK
jgi:hypothetical protein